MFWGVVMYKKPDKRQITIEDFFLPFGGKLSADNDWIKLAGLMPWDMIEDIYMKKFKNDKTDGRPPISSRIAFGSLFIKSRKHLTDEFTLELISENPYMQYFLGLREFRQELLFDISMMVHFRKRFTDEEISQINEELYRRMNPTKEDDDTQGNDFKEGEEAKEIENKGNLILDATVAPSDVRYPTDLSLLNECRENIEKIIDGIWEQTERVGHKTPYNRKKARKSYLRVAKQRKPRKKQLKQSISEQLEYVEKGLLVLEKLRQEIPVEALDKRQNERIGVIQRVAKQQRTHIEDPKAKIDDRIVNLRQSHVRPIVRGKAGAAVEFGQKVTFSVVDRYTFIEKQSWDNFNEGITLIDSVMKYKERHGFFPEAIMADTIYRTRENRKFCKDNGIRLSGPRLGRPKKDEIERDKEQSYIDSCKRNIVESRNGIVKRKYGMNRILTYLNCTSKTEVAMAVLAMNVGLHLKELLCLIFRKCIRLKCRV